MLKRLLIPLLIFMLVFSLPVMGKNIDLKGKVKQNMFYNEEIEPDFNGSTELNLEITKEFGYTGSLYLNPTFELYYNEDSELNEIDFNERLNGKKTDILREGYLDLYLGNSDLRIGKQLCSWGTAYKINPTDVVNPIDFTAEDPDEEELGVSAFKHKYYFNNNTILTSVLIGEHRASPLPEGFEDNTVSKLNDIISEKIVNISGSRELAATIMQENIVVNNATERDIDNFKEAEYAFKFTRRDLRGYDVSFSYFDGYDDLPLIKEKPEDIMTEIQAIAESYPVDKKVVINPGYKEVRSLGVNVIGSLGECGIWSETNYSKNEDDEIKIDTVLGGDYKFENNFYTVAQLFHRRYKDYRINDFLAASGQEKLLQEENLLILHGEKPFRSIHQWQANLIYDIDNSVYLLNPELNFSIANGVNLDLGTMVLQNGNEAIDFSLLNMLGQEKTYLQLSYHF